MENVKNESRGFQPAIIIAGIVFIFAFVYFMMDVDKVKKDQVTKDSITQTFRELKAEYETFQKGSGPRDVLGKILIQDISDFGRNFVLPEDLKKFKVELEKEHKFKPL